MIFYRRDRETFELAEQIIVVTLVGISFRQQTRARWILTETRIDRFDVTRQGTGTIDRFDGQSVVATIGPEILSTIVSWRESRCLKHMLQQPNQGSDFLEIS